MRRLSSSRFLSARAFTLIEILVVILIIGILVAVAAPSFLGQTQKAEDAAAKQYLTVAYKAAKAYSTDSSTDDVQGHFDGFDQAALQAMEPGLTAEVIPGGCPASAAGDPHTHITIDTANDDNLVICNDPEERVWVLEVEDGVLKPLALCEWNGSRCTNQPDTSLPTISLTAPANGATVFGSVSVTATAADDDAVAGVQFKLDGNNLGSEDTEAPYSVSWDTTTVSSGAHTLSAVARDVSNNTQTSSSVSVTVSNSPVNTAQPQVTGSGVEGSQLSVSSGSWTGSPTSYSYQWYRCATTAESSCTTQVASTASTYVAIGDDVGSYLRAQVAASNAAGTGAAVFSTASVQITASTPTLSSLSPTSRPAGASAFTLTVNGGSFLSGATVRWNGADRTTTYVSGSQLTAAIPASDVTTAGSATVTVRNPGGAISSAQTFTITVPQPAYVQAVLDSGPKGYYRLGEAANATVMPDTSTAGYNGTYVGSQVLFAAPGLLSSGTNGARNFYLNTVYGSVPYQAAMNASQFSVEFLLRINQGFWQSSTSIAEVVNAGSFRIYGRTHTGTSTQGTLGVQLPGSAGLALNFNDQNGVVVLPNTTYHVVVSYDGTTMRIYLNGQLRAAAAVSGYIPNTSAAMRIGSAAGVTQHANTILDEVAFYDKALTCGTTTVGQSCTAGNDITLHNAAK